MGNNILPPIDAPQPQQPQQSFLGRVGGVLGRIGDVTRQAYFNMLDYDSPEAAARVPGTRSYQMAQQAMAMKQAESESLVQMREAETERAKRPEPAKEVSQGASLVSPEGKVIYQNPPKPTTVGLHPLTVEDAEGNPVPAVMDLATQKVYGVGGALINQPKVYQKPDSPGGFEEAAYQQELLKRPKLTREQFTEEKEGRAEQRQQQQQQRTFTQQDEMADRREKQAFRKEYVSPLNSLETNYQQAKRVVDEAERRGTITGPESMVALSRHMMLTIGAIKGSRMGQYLFQEHMTARPLIQSLEVIGQKVAGQGGVITMDQARQFVKLAKEIRDISRDVATGEAKLRGYNEKEMFQSVATEGGTASGLGSAEDIAAWRASRGTK